MSRFLPEIATDSDCNGVWILHEIKQKAHDFSRGMNPTTHGANHSR